MTPRWWGTCPARRHVRGVAAAIAWAMTIAAPPLYGAVLYFASGGH